MTFTNKYNTEFQKTFRFRILRQFDFENKNTSL